MVITKHLSIKTNGNTQILDTTDQVQQAVNDSGLLSGIAVLFAVGSTAGLTTLEYEPGLVQTDIKAAFERIAPKNDIYAHEDTWNDDNGHSHVRAALLGPSLTVPFTDGRLTLGTWQQLVLIDFDTRPRNRTIVCQILGENDSKKTPEL
ncbi:MAG: secondary thiamine-phosphate synthase enzyme YjbQ [Anaerohalosphaeraceae bacterium]